LLNLLVYYDYCFAFDSTHGLHIACPETGGWFKKKQTYLKPYQKMKKMLKILSSNSSAI